MKTIPAGLLAVYQSGASTICACLRVERTDGVIERFTSHDVDVPITTLGAPYDGTYKASTGLEVSSLVVQSGLAVDNMELTVFPDETDYPQVDIIAGRWDSAAFRLFECSYLDTSLGVNLLKRGTTGQADTLRSTNRFEFRGLKQALQQQLGAVTSKTCRYRLGSTAMPQGLCLVDLAPFTHDHAVTGVTSRHVITCSGAAEASDYYGDGIAISLDGPNAGFERRIKSFAAGVFTLAIEFPYEVSIADTFTFIAGCRKRLIEDCKTKFNNVLNFGGEPHVPGADLLTADPEVT